MPIITKITQQKKNTERYNIYLDEEYAFSVDATVLVKFELRKGMLLEDWIANEVQYEEEIAKAFNRALHYLSFRMRSEQEVKNKLVELDYGEAVILEAIAKLKKLGFLNDAEFARALVSTRRNGASKGPRAIRVELQQKGIAKELQEEVLETFADDEQLAVARQLIEKELRRTVPVSPRQREQRIYQNLQRKGYSHEIIQQAIKQSDLSIEEDEWEAVLEKYGEKAWSKVSVKYTGYDRIRRVKQALYLKGIPAEKIEAFIARKEEENE